MAYIYSIANQKGGVGKTTSAVNLSAYLAASGKRVLLIDMDPQANATSSLGVPKEKQDESSYELLLGGVSAQRATLKNPKTGVCLIPSSTKLAAAEVELVGELAREYRLKNALETCQSTYDYILIDCPPSLGLLTVNALTAASDGVIIPVQCEYLALEGLSQLTRTVDLVQQRLNSALCIRGLAMTMFDARTTLSQQVVNEVEKHFGALVFHTRIPRNVRLSEAPSHGQPIVTYSPDSPGGLAYRRLAEELVAQDEQRGTSMPASRTEKHSLDL